MSTVTPRRGEPVSAVKPIQREIPTTFKAWVAKAAKQPMVLETLDLGPLGAEEVEVAVEHCGLCHSDLSVLNNDWGISQYPAILGHEVDRTDHRHGPECQGTGSRTARGRRLVLR